MPPPSIALGYIGVHFVLWAMTQGWGFFIGVGGLCDGMF